MDRNESEGLNERLSHDAKLALHDLFHFGNFFWGLDLEEKPHRWVCDELMKTLEMEDTPNLILDVPRGCYKTSIVTAGAIWQYLRQCYFHDNPYHRIVYASNTLGLGEAFLDLIENVLRAGGRNGRIDEHYGPLWTSPTKGQRRSSRRKDGLILKPRMDRGEVAAVRDPNFFIASIGALPIGKHADGAILDDLNNKANVLTTDRLRKTHEFYRQIYPIINTTERTGAPSHIWMCCTPWNDNDVRGMVIREEEEKALESPDYSSPWRIVKATSRNADGSLFFPSKLTEKELTRLKSAMGSEYFAAYEGSPISKQDSIAQEEQIRFKPLETFPPLRWCRIVADPNQHNEARVLGCYAAIVLGGYDNFGKLWITDIRASREWDTKEFINVLFEIRTAHPTWSMFIEDQHMTHFDHAVNLEWVRRMDEASKIEGAPPVHRLNINWVPSPRNMSKYERCEKIKPRFQSAAICFAQEIAPSIREELRNELLRGRASRFKDIVDALAMMENGIVPRYKPSGEGEVVSARLDTGGNRPRGMTFGDALGPMFQLVGDN